MGFPIIVPPFAVGVLVLFSAYFHDLTSPLQMVGVAFALLLLDLLAMQGARRIMALIGPSSLHVLGAVFGVLQLALALQRIRFNASGVSGPEIRWLWSLRLILIPHVVWEKRPICHGHRGPSALSKVEDNIRKPDRCQTGRKRRSRH